MQQTTATAGTDHLPAGFNEYGALRRVALRRAEDAFIDAAAIDTQWRALNYPAAPDFARACEEYARFESLLREAGAEVEYLPRDERVGLDGIYVRDATLVAPGGVILCGMGKPARALEPLVAGEFFRARGWPVLGSIEAPAQVEGGDLVWLDEHTLVAGHGYRTNAAGIARLRELLGASVEVVEVPLVHWKGEADVFHLMSLLSPLDGDLALVYSPLMPVPFRNWLLARGLRLVEVPDEEFESMGCNVLALAPRKVLMLAGNPRTAARLGAAGVEVIEYRGEEISAKGCGGPTCLTRPLVRA